MGQVIPSSTFVVQGEAGSISRNVRVPDTAIAVTGLTITAQGSFTRHISLELVTSEGVRVAAFMAFRGRKSSVGTFPIYPGVGLTLGTVVAAADAAITYSILVEFLVVQGQPPYLNSLNTPYGIEWQTGPFTNAVPFKAGGGDDQIVTVTGISAATTAQTIDIGPLGNVDAIQPLEAMFQTNAPSTATGNTGIWDGAIRTDIDTTAAVAGYVFNLGAKGSQFILADQLGTGLTWRTVIGAAGAGTSTVYLTYRAVMLR